jgi:hypothetical protein
MIDPDKEKLLLVTTRLYRMAFRMCTMGRNIFISSSGHVGIGPQVQQDDLITIFPGVSVPCILRPTGNGRFRFQGEAYILGIMHGEFLETNPDSIDLEIE